MTIETSSSTPRLVSFLCAGLVGCGSSDRDGFDRYLPGPDAARAAVSTALAAWKSGRPTGRVEGATPTVEVVDSSRRPQRPLKSFEVVGPVGGDEARVFAVRLILDDPPEEKVERYKVIGREPLWVFREEDFDLIAHWEHAMDKPEADSP